MGVRQYEFIVGPTTSELPTVGTPTGTTDLISLGYADENYMQGGSYKSTKANLKDVAASARKTGDVRYVAEVDWFYRFNGSATGVDDSDITLQPTTGSGRWIKALQGNLSNFASLTDSQTLANKAVSGSYAYDDFYIKSTTGTNRKVGWSASGATNTTQTTFFFAQTADRAITFQDADHTVVGRNTTDMLSNKTLLTPVIDDYMDINEESAPSTPSSGKIRVYGKTDKKLYAKNSDGTESQLGGGGSGSGEVNVISSPNDANSWAASASGVTVATTTTANELPLGPTVSTGIKITPVSGSDYAYFRWTMPESLKNRKLKAEWFQRYLSSYATGDFKVQIYKNSASDYGGSYTEFQLSTHSSSVSSLPAYNGKYTTTFDADSSDYYEMRIVRTAGTSALILAGVVVGPGVQPQGFAGDDGQTVTVTGSWVSNTTYTARMWRRGNRMRLTVRVIVSGAPTSTALTITLPNSLAMDTSKLLNSGDFDQPLGVCSLTDASTGDVYPGLAYYATSTTIQVGTLVSSKTLYVTQAVPMTFANNDEVYMDIEVPIAAWSGGGTVNLAQNDVEYAYTAGTWDADSSTAGYGPGGVQMGGALTAERTKTVTWLTPVQPTDTITLEMSGDSGATWFNAGSSYPYFQQNTLKFGAKVSSSSVTQTQVIFGTYRQSTNSTYGTATSATDWTNGLYWRLKKIKGGVAVGFGIVSETSAGLVPSTNANLDNASATRLGLKQYAHGTTYNGGAAPTITLTSGGGTLSSITSSNFIPYQTQSGGWRMKFNFVAAVSSTSRTNPGFAINGVTFKNVSNYLQACSGFNLNSPPTGVGYVSANTGTVFSEHSAASATAYSFSGDVELESKPTWAY